MLKKILLILLALMFIAATAYAFIR